MIALWERARRAMPWGRSTSILTCKYCGWLGWTVESYGRVTHKHACPYRVDSYCQAHEVCR